MTADFSFESMEVRRDWNNIFKVKEKNCQSSEKDLSRRIKTSHMNDN